MTKERGTEANLWDYFTTLPRLHCPLHFPQHRSRDIFAYKLQTWVRDIVHLKSREKHPK